MPVDVRAIGCDWLTARKFLYRVWGLGFWMTVRAGRRAERGPDAGGRARHRLRLADRPQVPVQGLGFCDDCARGQARRAWARCRWTCAPSAATG